MGTFNWGAHVSQQCAILLIGGCIKIIVSCIKRIVFFRMGEVISLLHCGCHKLMMDISTSIHAFLISLLQTNSIIKHNRRVIFFLPPNNHNINSTIQISSKGMYLQICVALQRFIWPNLDLLLLPFPCHLKVKIVFSLFYQKQAQDLVFLKA